VARTVVPGAPGAWVSLPAEGLGRPERFIHGKRKRRLRSGAEGLAHHFELETALLLRTRELPQPEEAALEAALQGKGRAHARDHAAQVEPAGVAIQGTEGQGRGRVAEGRTGLGQEHARGGLAASKVVESDGLVEGDLLVAGEACRLFPGGAPRAIARPRGVETRGGDGPGRAMMQPEPGLEERSEIPGAEDHALHVDQPRRPLEGAEEPVDVGIGGGGDQRAAGLAQGSHLRDGGWTDLEVAQSGLRRELLEECDVLIRRG
jgi:hypothetical protein